MENELTVEDLDHILGLLRSEIAMYENHPRITRIEDRYQLIWGVEAIIKKIEAMKARARS